VMLLLRVASSWLAFNCVRNIPTFYISMHLSVAFRACLPASAMASMTTQQGDCMSRVVHTALSKRAKHPPRIAGSIGKVVEDD
jgi:hypothetical protein